MTISYRRTSRVPDTIVVISYPLASSNRSAVMLPAFYILLCPKEVCDNCPSLRAMEGSRVYKRGNYSCEGTDNFDDYGGNTYAR
jgi:hypothetical protein